MTKTIKEKVRLILLTFISIIGLILVILIWINFSGEKTDIVDGINGQKIQEIKIGMTMENVISILGRPLTINVTNGVHSENCKSHRNSIKIKINKNSDLRNIINKIFSDTNYCCEGNREEMRTKDYSFIYTRPVFGRFYPMLWVHFDSLFNVECVAANKYYFIEHFTIYNLSKDGQIYLNKKLFNECFK